MGEENISVDELYERILANIERMDEGTMPTRQRARDRVLKDLALLAMKTYEKDEPERA